ncbi:hypothetical protein [Klebsiella pneumoniae]|uniref:hypothetical protein n=1 Tax=Klebsiella pneumoniae TaxID=573 RepID=UPI003D1F8406
MKIEFNDKGVIATATITSTVFEFRLHNRAVDTALFLAPSVRAKEGANKQVISSQADSLIKISRIWADFFPANTSNQPI